MSEIYLNLFRTNYEQLEPHNEICGRIAEEIIVATVGDMLILEEMDESGDLTGRRMERVITKVDGNWVQANRIAVPTPEVAELLPALSDSYCVDRLLLVGEVSL